MQCGTFHRLLRLHPPSHTALFGAVFSHFTPSLCIIAPSVVTYHWLQHLLSATDEIFNPPSHKSIAKLRAICIDVSVFALARLIAPSPLA